MFTRYSLYVYADKTTSVLLYVLVICVGALLSWGHRDYMVDGCGVLVQEGDNVVGCPDVF